MTRGWSPIRRRSPSQVGTTCTPKHTLPFGPDPAPGEFDDRGAEQVAAQRDRVAPRDIALRADRLEPDEGAMGKGVHARMNAAGGNAQANGNFESLELN